MSMKEYLVWQREHPGLKLPFHEADLNKLLELFNQIPPRGPLGSFACKEWERTTQKFEREARSQGIDPFEAYKLCREKKENAVTSQNTC